MDSNVIYKQVYSLTPTEFKSIAGTEQYQQMLRNKFMVHLSDTDLEYILVKLANELTSHWFYYIENHSTPQTNGTYVFYFQYEVGSDMFKNLLDKNIEL